MKDWSPIVALAARAQSGDRGAEAEILRRCRPFLRQRLAEITSASTRRIHGEDLEQEASIGLVEGVRRWEPARGHVAGSMAIWMRARVMKFLRMEAAIVRGDSGGRHRRPEVLYLEDLLAEVQDRAMPRRIAYAALEALTEAPRQIEDGDLYEAVLARRVVEGLRRIIDRRSFEAARVAVTDDETFVDLGERWGLSRERVRQIASRGFGEIHRALRLKGALASADHVVRLEIAERNLRRAA